ncbi:hypothetical protein H8A99_23265 [Bradyrhizobium sp. Arg68]|uniref:hypothetical protein n=1 Tax=Bradyrhizobium ivorense TaxID=2511166 RepID=UPI001E3DA6F6|nr:hypothetical protein [Bradyrhizobium ivorense]MCC8939313.1 hypothetical protein [Bradyrhizobium ivorense]
MFDAPAAIWFGNQGVHLQQICTPEIKPSRSDREERRARRGAVGLLRWRDLAGHKIDGERRTMPTSERCCRWK